MTVPKYCSLGMLMWVSFFSPSTQKYAASLQAGGFKKDKPAETFEWWVFSILTRNWELSWPVTSHLMWVTLSSLCSISPDSSLYSLHRVQLFDFSFLKLYTYSAAPSKSMPSRKQAEFPFVLIAFSTQSRMLQFIISSFLPLVWPCTVQFPFTQLPSFTSITLALHSCSVPALHLITLSTFQKVVKFCFHKVRLTLPLEWPSGLSEELVPGQFGVKSVLSWLIRGFPRELLHFTSIFLSRLSIMTVRRPCSSVNCLTMSPRTEREPRPPSWLAVSQTGVQAYKWLDVRQKGKSLKMTRMGKNVFIMTAGLRLRR